MDSVKGNFKGGIGQVEEVGKPKPSNRYSTPRLVEYGTLAKLTRAKTPGAADGGTMSACL
jgi:hypothetical protein